MILNKYFLLTTVILLSFNLSAQDYFVVDTDTTYCTNLEYATTGQGFLKKLEYTNQIGQEVSLQGRSKIPDIEVFYIDSSFIVKCPHNPEKPNNGYIRYNERVVNGKLKVYLSHYSAVTSSGSSVTASRFFLEMPDGTYYNILKKSNIKKYIKPYLLECTAFRKSYKGDFKRGEKVFIEMIELYNSLCE